jgi:hypothetical protein
LQRHQCRRCSRASIESELVGTGFRQLDAIPAATLGLIQYLVCRSDEIIMPGLLVSHEAGEPMLNRA